MLCLEVNKDNFDKNMEKIKNEEKLSNALPVSIKYGWRSNDAVYVLHNKHNVYIGAQNLLQKKNEDQFHVY